MVKEDLPESPGGRAEHEVLGAETLQGRGVLVAQAVGEAGEQHQQEGDEGDDRGEQREAALGEGDVPQGQEHGVTPVTKVRIPTFLQSRARGAPGNRHRG
ncbi:hypothetical protein KVA01_18990 [Kocuria varians]|uniref:Uncharacterized protein n=1 Tax=Kocuria varians TaxID=1272 RepID=A0A4Y4D7S0_KOCVA|nr:hypothetical protein KVA01_18990 [Kocuria varians]